MIGSVVTRLIPDEGPAANITGFTSLTVDEQRVLVASSVTFLVGIMQVGNLFNLSVHYVSIYCTWKITDRKDTMFCSHVLVSKYIQTKVVVLFPNTFIALETRCDSDLARGLVSAERSY